MSKITEEGTRHRRTPEDMEMGKLLRIGKSGNKVLELAFLTVILKITKINQSKGLEQSFKGRCLNH